MDVIKCFLENNTSPLLTWCTVITPKLSDKTKKFLSNYCYLFWGYFLLGHSVVLVIVRLFANLFHQTSNLNTSLPGPACGSPVTCESTSLGGRFQHSCPSPRSGGSGWSA